MRQGGSGAVGRLLPGVTPLRVSSWAEQSSFWLVQLYGLAWVYYTANVLNSTSQFPERLCLTFAASPPPPPPPEL